MKILLIILVFFYNSKIFAQEKVVNNKSQIDIEQLIKSRFSFEDSSYNLLYENRINKFLSQEEKTNFKNKIKDLLNARNYCIEYSEKLTSQQTEFDFNDKFYFKNSTTLKKQIQFDDFITNNIPMINVDYLNNKKSIVKLNKQDIANACISTWYYSMKNIITLNDKYPHIFKIPSYHEYIAELNNLQPPPFFLFYKIIDKETLKRCKENLPNCKNKNYIKNANSQELEYCEMISSQKEEECLEESAEYFNHALSYEIFFPILDLPFVKLTISTYTNSDHPYFYGTVGFVIKKNASKTKKASMKNDFFNEKLKNLFLFFDDDTNPSIRVFDDTEPNLYYCNQHQESIAIVNNIIYLRDTYEYARWEDAIACKFLDAP